MIAYSVFLTVTVAVGVDAADTNAAVTAVRDALAAGRIYFDPKKAEVVDIQRRVDHDAYIYPAKD